MITLNILQLLEDNGFGRANFTGDLTGDDLLWHEALPEGKTGIYIISNGDPLDRSQRTKQSFDLYVRGVNDLQGVEWLEDILEFFTNECYPVCDLPDVEIEGVVTNGYRNCTIKPTSNIQNIGKDETNRKIYSCTAQIGYKLKENQ